MDLGVTGNTCGCFKIRPKNGVFGKVFSRAPSAKKECTVPTYRSSLDVPLLLGLEFVFNSVGT